MTVKHIDMDSTAEWLRYIESQVPIQQQCGTGSVESSESQE